ncbi:MAG: hypothetical protein ACYSU3_20280 [Planctomycetota bacterium]|jgi:hypothetical protein
MKRTFIYLVILFFLVVSAVARQVELTLHSANAPKPPNKYQLLPKANEQSDADAVPLYEKAVQSLSRDSQRDQKIRQWLKTPLNKLPRKQIESTLQQFKPTLRLVEQAAGCKQCNWPPVKIGTLPNNLPEYRTVAYILSLQARLQIAQGQYDQAVRTIQTGLAMARRMGEAPDLSQGLVGVAIGAVILNQMEALVQAPDSPDLYQALQALPEPLVDLTKTIDLEIANLKNYNFLLRWQFEKQLKPAHDRVRLTMKRLDRNVAALQCVEALRLYAGAHNGKFPNALTDITRVSIPTDPITKKPFVYHRTGSAVILEAPAPKGAIPEYAMQYKLTLKE